MIALSFWFRAFDFGVIAMNDNEYMGLALKLAEKGCGFVSPNPMVGAVIVKDGRIIGQGWHQRYGQPHAERNALSACTESPKGATMYVTLEPCCHYGKQPPCVDAILQSGISRVVVGSADPNPLVSGKGIQILQQNGIDVAQGVMKDECDRLNEVFFYYIQTKLPFVVMKYAMTMDGKIATSTGASKWITGEQARAHVQQQRHKYTAIMVGIGTVLADDPLLNCRIEGGISPIRIICDSNLRTPLSSQIVATAAQIPTIIAACCDDEERRLPYIKSGCEVLSVPGKDGQIDLTELMKLLGERNIDSILLEGGGTLNWSALESGIVNKVQAYIAPKLLGGQSAKTPVEGRGFSEIKDSPVLKNSVITRLGEDILIESEVDGGVYRNC